MSEPAYMKVARSKVGMREIPGKTHNNALINFLNTASRWNGVKWVDDEMAWCGGLVAACMVAAGFEPVRIAARARSWSNWGVNLRPTHLSVGAVLVFDGGPTRPGAGHVGFYVGEDDLYYHVLGGNQSNMVNISRILKSRLIASRWPKGLPVITGPVRMTNVAGVKVSTSEA